MITHYYYTIFLFLLLSSLTISQETKTTKVYKFTKPILTLESLLNCEYPYGVKSTINLNDGSCIDQILDFDAEFVKHISCELNGDSLIDAIVVLDIRDGGTGRWQYVYPVINNNGSPNPIFPFELDDRESVQKIYKNNGKIFLEVLVHNINDPICCPTLKETWKLIFKENKFNFVN